MTKNELKARALSVLEMMAEQTIEMHGNNRGTVVRRDQFRRVGVAAKRWLLERGMIDQKVDALRGEGFAVTGYGLEYLDSLTKQTQNVNEVALLDYILESI
jgi:hypothetical protein